MRTPNVFFSIKERFYKLWSNTQFQLFVAVLGIAMLSIPSLINLGQYKLPILAIGAALDFAVFFKSNKDLIRARKELESTKTRVGLEAVTHHNAMKNLAEDFEESRIDGRMTISRDTVQFVRKSASAWDNIHKELFKEEEIR